MNLYVHHLQTGHLHHSYARLPESNNHVGLYWPILSFQQLFQPQRGIGHLPVRPGVLQSERTCRDLVGINVSEVGWNNFNFTRYGWWQSEVLWAETQLITGDLVTGIRSVFAWDSSCIHLVRESTLLNTQWWLWILLRRKLLKHETSTTSCTSRVNHSINAMESIEFQSQQLRLTSPSFSGLIVPCSKWPHYQPHPNIIVAIIYPSTFPYSICVYIRTYIYMIYVYLNIRIILCIYIQYTIINTYIIIIYIIIHL